MYHFNQIKQYYSNINRYGETIYSNKSNKLQKIPKLYTYLTLKIRQKVIELQEKQFLTSVQPLNLLC